MPSKRSGFTLVEVVVVIAVVALLSAILVPLVAKQIDEAKIGRARNECLVIAAAIQQFYKDVGVFPAASTHYNNYMRTLVSGTAVDPDAPLGTATQYGFTVDGNDNWYDGGGFSEGDGDNVDSLDNHLNQNNPQGLGAFYATTGEFRWRGPYLPPIGMDPWGHAYMCNIGAAFALSNAQCVVMSAGSNGAIDTAFNAASGGALSTDAGPSGDDIWATVHSRP